MARARKPKTSAIEDDPYNRNEVIEVGKDIPGSYFAATTFLPDTGAWRSFYRTLGYHSPNIAPQILITTGQNILGGEYNHYWREDLYLLPLRENQQELALGENERAEQYLKRTRLFYSANIVSL